MNKEFSFGQRVKYDGHDEVCIITGRAITDPSGNPTSDWWRLATPDLPSVLTHAKNIEAIADEEVPSHAISLADACRVWLNLPEWIRFYEDIKNPMFLGTMSVAGDEEVRMQMYKALGLDRLKVTVSGDGINKQQAWALFDVAVRAYLWNPKQQLTSR